MNEAEFEALVSGSEPQAIRRWLTSVKFGSPLTEGSMTPAILPQWHQHDKLYLPFPPSTPLNYTAVYIILDDYVSGVGAVEARVVMRGIVGSYARDDLLIALTQLNLIAADATMIREYTSEFAQCLRPDLGERLIAATDHRQRKVRVLVSRQGIFAAMKAALEASPYQPQPSRTPALVAATLLVHAVSTLLNPETDVAPNSDEIMMDFVRNVAFNSRRDRVSHLADHIELWESVGSAVIGHPPLTAPELVLQITGLDVRDILAFTFAVSNAPIVWKPGRDLMISDTLPGCGRSPEDIGRYVGLVAATPDELLAAYNDESDGEWNFLPFQRTPIIRLTGGRLLVLDQTLLFERVTDGLYWDVHDHLRDNFSNDARLTWTHAYGKMVEKFVTSRFSLLAPAGLSHPTFYSEDELRQAYSRSKVSDGAIDMGERLLVIEVVSGRLGIAARIHGNAAAFRRDTEHVVMKKVRQLDSIARRVLHDEHPLTGREPVPGRRVQPLLVAGSGYPVEPTSASYIENEAVREGLLRDGRIEPLAVIDLDELSMLVGLAERGHAPDRLLSGWKNSGIRNIPCKNWLLERVDSSATNFRPRQVEALWNNLEKDITERLLLPDREAAKETPT